jgi:uncharacterized membrane protein
MVDIYGKIKIGRLGTGRQRDLNIFTETRRINGKAVGSLLIGLISIAGIMLVGEGAVLSLAGLILGFTGLRETKQGEQTGFRAAAAGLILNAIGIISLIL